MSIRIDLFEKYTLKCPECGCEYDCRDGYFRCLECGTQLWTKKECLDRGYAKPAPNIINVGEKPTPIVTCPYCHSINTRKISDASRIMGALFGDVYAIPMLSKEWHCKNCDSDF